MSEIPPDPVLNTVTWWEIPVTDLDEAARFYPAVFGWTVAPFGDGYLSITHAGRMIGGLYRTARPGVGDGVRLYVTVADLEEILDAAVAAGGSVVTPRTAVGDEMGWWAEIADPAGRRLGLWTERDRG